MNVIDLFGIGKAVKEKKSNPIVDLLNKPENYILMASLDGEDIVVRICKKPNKED